eukprot:11157985-Lingulodinium_polyedra.AAC.1
MALGRYSLGVVGVTDLQQQSDRRLAPNRAPLVEVSPSHCIHNRQEYIYTYRAQAQHTST